ncbi:MAG: hypothetical protein U9Q96_02875 [Patescibacteria group bacterium]|nr:hypothetical protein [Patescibacteria group bacterium]
MLWIIFTIISYFLLSLTAIIDEILLTGRLIKPKVYAFYVGILGGLVFVLIPFGFEWPDIFIASLAILSGAFWIFALLALYEALRRYEISRIIPAVGGILPIFTMVITYLFAWQQGSPLESLSYLKIISFLLLVIGSILITWKGKEVINRKSLMLSILTALLFALSFVTAKIVFLAQPFISGFIWLRMGSFLVALFFIFFKEVRKELFGKIKTKKEKSFFKNPKLIALFIFNQIVGAGAGVLQTLAIYLAPIMYLAFINAMEGIRYVFILIFTIVLSYKMPKLLSEKITKPILLKKVSAILLIIIGLVMLAID